MDKSDFAAVPVHFRPGEGKEKKIKLVIPGIEPPLAFLIVSGKTPETITTEFVDNPEGDQSQEEITEDIEESVDEEVNETEDEDVPESNDTDAGASAEIAGEEESTPDERDEVEYPYEDDAGNPVAGFLVAKTDEAQPPVILVKPEFGEQPNEAIDRVKGGHPDHKVASLDEATAKLGHSPLTSKDN